MSKFIGKLIYSVSAIVSIGIGLILAQDAAGDIRPATSVNLTDLFRNTLGLIVPIIVFVLLGMIIYGGYTRLTAAGDPEKEEQSNQIITSAIIGFVIIALAPLIVNLLAQFLGIGQIIG